MNKNINNNCPNQWSKQINTPHGTENSDSTVRSVNIRGFEHGDVTLSSQSRKALPKAVLPKANLKKITSYHERAVF